MKRKMVYICSPYSGDVLTNTDKARFYSRCAVWLGYIPIAPHLLFPQFMNDDDRIERELGLEFAMELMSVCDEVWVFGDEVSAGMRAEIAKAKKMDKKIRYFDSAGQEIHQAIETE